MNTLEQEIFEKFGQLPPEAKKRVLILLQQEIATDEESTFDFAAWSRKVEALRQQIQVNQTDPLDVIKMLRDMRDG